MQLHPGRRYPYTVRLVNYIGTYLPSYLPTALIPPCTLHINVVGIPTYETSQPQNAVGCYLVVARGLVVVFMNLCTVLYRILQYGQYLPNVCVSK